jgi:hypothetical protein
MLEIPHCLDNQLTDGGKAVSPMHLLHFTPKKYVYFAEKLHRQSVIVVTNASSTDSIPYCDL